MSKTINLLPDPVIETQKESSTVYQGTLVSIIGLVVFVLINLIIFLLVTYATNIYDDVQTKTTEVEAEIRANTELNQDLRSIRARLQRYAKLDFDHVDAADVYGGVVDNANEDVVIHRYIMSEFGLQVESKANSLESAVDFLRAIRRNELLSNIQITDIGYTRIDDDVVTFETIITIKEDSND